jgi:hypothetical protein
VKDGLLCGWIVKIEDVTEVATKIGELVDARQFEDAEALLPAESPYDFLDEATRGACDAD